MQGYSYDRVHGYVGLDLIIPITAQLVILPKWVGLAD